MQFVVPGPEMTGLHGVTLWRNDMCRVTLRRNDLRRDRHIAMVSAGQGVHGQHAGDDRQDRDDAGDRNEPTDGVHVSSLASPWWT